MTRASAKTPSRQTVLITGFPRSLTKRLARRALTARPRRTVTLFVRSPDQNEAKSWVQHFEPNERRYLKVVVGDLESVDCGLSGTEARTFQSQLSHIFHADVDSSTPLRDPNRPLGQLARLLEFAKSCDNLRRFVFFSSTFVSGDRSGVVFEEDLECGQRLRTRYEKYLYSAERILRATMPRLPITVLRPSSTIGHSQTGEANGLTEGPSYLLSLMLRLPTEIPVFLPGSGIVPFNIVPVNYVVDAAWTLAHKPDASGRTFHLTDPNPVNAKQAFELLADLANRPAPRFGNFIASLVRRLVRETGLGQLLPFTRVFLGDLTKQVTYDCAGTLELLTGTDVRCPPFEAYADALVLWMASVEGTQRPTST